MIGRTAALAILVVLPGYSLADACAQMEDFAASGLLKSANGLEAQCSVSRVLGTGPSEDCFYRYPFRSDSAHEHFESLLGELRACAEGPLETEETGVNHPDSFDQVMGQVNGVRVSLSLKDKGGLAQTLVVLRRSLP